MPSVLGLPEPSGPGVAGWLAAGADALSRLKVQGPGPPRLLARGNLGSAPVDGGRGEVLAAVLATDRVVFS